MPYKIEVVYEGTENFILDAPGEQEAGEMAAEKVMDKYPGVVVTDLFIETLTAQDRRELNHADEL